ncbi:fatty acyl-CoA reductase wat [Agrilus planipennis]|uniref:Fatty acyl-CoA reductase n=1 Tax=Agrilus planipennis TaxID=224129 RepID=A0A1W4W338_AGRPL|nr:fatty acyl-CoA reductase wat [Agrilus planipennis]XP_018318581.1 fatty acyl-CoA reductase wat [Agrilus planipennis]XP_018318582.1 fatty acyl-CoA reductase wat [Agrilus planipennis]
MTDLIENISVEATPIQKFYAGANIFVTGATGFLGRILVEKLLRSCPDVASIYILIRNKKGKTAHDRLDEMFDDVVFKRLKDEQPKFRHKVVAVAGDCCLPDLGMSMQDRQMLINEINIVFHVAATVRFDEKLKVAVAINVRSVQDVLKMSKEMLNLKAVVHVSTAFAYCHLNSIEERFYPPPMSYKKLLTFVDVSTETLLEKITPEVLDKWPNTYTYTKAVGEDVVNCEGVGLPVAVFRPSIVISTYKEPIKAWINNMYGPTGVVMGAGIGLLHSLHCNPKVNANIVPVDMCVNALIASAWETNKNFEESQKLNKQPPSPPVPIYHFESSNENPIAWGSFMDKCSKYGMRTPTVKAVWYYYLSLQTTLIGHNLLILFMHFLPAFLCDMALTLFGKQPRLIKVYKKIHKFCAVISYFSTRSFEFGSKRVRSMIRNMTEQDQKIFFCDLRKLDWDEFFLEYTEGIRVYLIGDPIETLEAAKIRWRKLYYLHQGLKLLLLFFVVRILWAVLKIIFF